MGAGGGGGGGEREMGEGGRYRNRVKGVERTS